jgi:transposase InsO family protein
MNQRKEFVLKALESENFRAHFAEYGISTKTGYKWKARLLEHGLEGLSELSRRPQSHAKELGEAVVCEIIRIKHAHRTWGPRKIRKVYERGHSPVPSESSFKRVLERAGLVEARRLRSRSESGRLFSGRKAAAANEIWSVDFKGWWRVGGLRCEPLTVRDEFSRYVLDVRAVADGRTATVRACFERLFEQNGLPGAIRSDNGSPFASLHGVLGLSRLSAWWVAWGIDLERGRPGCPQDNSAHERLPLDIQKELRSQASADPQAGFDVWRQTFNHERPHESLGMRCPAELYTRSQRPYAGSPEDLVYEPMDSRRVNCIGEISWQGKQVFICSALAGWSVGLQPCGPSQYHVYFGRLMLGRLDESTGAFARTGIEPQSKKKAA